MSKQFKDFVNTTGKNIGEIQNTKLADFFGVDEGVIRKQRLSDSLKFDCLYLGAICKANNFTKEDLKNLIKNNEFKDFVNTTGKNVGEIQNTKLANFFGVTEGAIRKLKLSDSLKFDCLYLGTICKANNFTKEDLIYLIKNNDVIDFLITSGKNIGDVDNAKLASFLGVDEIEISNFKLNNSLYLGAICTANNISKEDLTNLIKNREV